MNNQGGGLLLHACCGPCLEWPASQLLSEGIRPVVWFYNPNIQPLAENQRRRDNLRQLAGRLQLTCLTEEGCEPETWQNWQDPAESRCRMCYRRRLAATAAKARELGLPAFSTTLLVSPYQDHEALREIGELAAREAGVRFLYRDYRPGYREGQQMARADGLYRQRYCGCLPSLEQSKFKEQIRRELADLSVPQSTSDSGRK